MALIFRYRSFILFYLIVASLTYALILRVEKLEENYDYIKKDALVINLW
ncbi:MAG: hypothetical protein PHF47_02790 [Bacilli bacterium]|nr:hypothetical protein [Bacilli bacterium]